jgi:hypothetical protein
MFEPNADHIISDIIMNRLRIRPEQNPQSALPLLRALLAIGRSPAIADRSTLLAKQFFHALDDFLRLGSHVLGDGFEILPIIGIGF